MFAGSYAYDNQGMQRSEPAQNHPHDNTLSFQLVVKLGENCRAVDCFHAF